VPELVGLGIIPAGSSVDMNSVLHLVRVDGTAAAAVHGFFLVMVTQSDEKL
jgi:hypothetical protein